MMRPPRVAREPISMQSSDDFFLVCALLLVGLCFFAYISDPSSSDVSQFETSRHAISEFNDLIDIRLHLVEVGVLIPQIA